MTLATERAKIGRKPITLVECDLDKCTLSYGVAPCTASLAAGFECYNTRKTCQDPANYTLGTKTYRFAENKGNLPADMGAIPCVKNVSLTPTRIDPAKGLGYLASVTVEMIDMPHHDRGIDPYISTRSFSPRGSFFGKLNARNPYYKGRTLRVMSGYISERDYKLSLYKTPFPYSTPLPYQGITSRDRSPIYDAANFETREYIIEKFEGPDSSGRVKITAKDILSKTNADKAQAPFISSGSLSAAITISDTSLTLQTGEGADYSTSGEVRIGDEIITYTGVTADTLTGLTRGAWNSVADAHDADSNVQQCVSWTVTNVVDVIYDLLVNYADIDPGYINTTDWNAEKISALSPFDVTAIITKPEGVKKLISELCQQSLSYVWWDERTQKIRLKSISPYTFDTELRDSINFIDVNVKDVPDDRISRMHVYYDIFDRVNPDKEESYKSVYVFADLESELATKHGEKKIKVIKSRWYQAQGPVAQNASRRVLWLRETPKRAMFKLDAKDGALWTGDPIDLISASVQDVTGATKPLEMFIIEATENRDGTFDYIAMDNPFSGRFGVVMADGTGDFAGANKGGWIALDSGLFSDGSEAFKII